jgi:RNA polymerase sigma-70 factor (ECF subfamily)
MSQEPPDYPEANISELIERCRKGDQDAASLLFRRYVDRLIVLVRGRMSQKLSRRLDPEDVLQSAYRSFFDGLTHGEFTIEQSDELWGLLTAITLHKLYRQVARHTAKKRSVKREEHAGENDGFMQAYPELIAELPTPSEAVGAVEELQQIMLRLAPLEQKVLELRLDGYSAEEIADQVKRSDRTVRRAMERIRGELQRRLMES